MLLDPTKTVRDLALTIPNATRVFEKAKIDYCCGGDRLLGDACARAGVDLDELERMLESGQVLVDNGADFQSMSLGQLITYILDKHHVFTKSEMERLETLTAKVVAAHGERHSELLAFRDLLRQLIGDLRPHMSKEEQILFPYLIELENSSLQNRPAPFAPFGTVNNPIRMMMMEHDTAGDFLREMRKLMRDYTVPADGCTSYQTLCAAMAEFESDLHQHIHLENNLVFPKAIELEDGVSQ